MPPLETRRVVREIAHLLGLVELDDYRERPLSRRHGPRGTALVRRRGATDDAPTDQCAAKDQGLDPSGTRGVGAIRRDLVVGPDLAPFFVRRHDVGITKNLDHLGDVHADTNLALDLAHGYPVAGRVLHGAAVIRSGHTGAKGKYRQQRRQYGF